MSSSVWCCCVASKDRVLLGAGAHSGSGCAVPVLHSIGAAGLENPMRPLASKGVIAYIVSIA